MKLRPLSVFLFFSVLLHVFLFLFLIWTEDRQSIDASWSGGLGDGSDLTYVDLEDFFSPAKSISGNKTIQKPEKKTTVSQKKSWGVGSSLTPAGGVGPGLDAVGQVSADSTHVIARIRKKIRAKQKYPQIALDHNWTGITKVGFQINEDGSLKFIKILNSSGYEILDEAAVKAVKSAAPLPYFSDPIALPIGLDIDRE